MRKQSLAVLVTWGVALTAILGRARAHPSHVLDLEGTFVAIAGRQLSQGHVRDFLGYQIDWYRGEPVIDGLLAALGFSLFGDHLMAWLLVSLIWVSLGVFAVATILRRLENPIGAVLFGALIACAPVLIKDGIASNTVGHAATPVLALLALLPLIPAPGRVPPAWKDGLLAGALMGGAIWYQRTAVLGIPALVLVASAGGRRVVASSLVGILAFPVLVSLNALLLLDVGGRRADGGFGEIIGKAFFGVEGGSTGDRAFMRSLLDPLGFGLQPLLNAVVATPPETPELAGRVQAALWPWASIIALASVGRASGARWRDPRWALPALAIAWTGGYAITSFEAEAGLFELLAADPTPAPSTSSTRYLIPCLFLWTAVTAQGLGQLAQGRTRWLAGGLAGSLLVTGAMVSARDLRTDPEARDAFRMILPFDYVGVYGHWVGPTRSFHSSCTSADPICRAHHLRTLGAWQEPSLRIIEGEGHPSLAAQLDATAQELSTTPWQRSFIAHGMGIELAQITFSTSEDSEFLERLERMMNELRALSPADAIPMARGFAEKARVRTFMSRSATATAHLACAPLHGERLLCPILVDIQAPSSDVMGWLAPHEPWLDELRRDLSVRGGEPMDDGATDDPVRDALRQALFRGLGSRLGSTHPPSEWPSLVEKVGEGDRDALRKGLAIGGRSRWRTRPTSDTPPWEHP